MSDETQPINADQEVEQIIETAHTLGVEVDETDVAQWLTAMAVSLRRVTPLSRFAGLSIVNGVVNIR